MEVVDALTNTIRKAADVQFVDSIFKFKAEGKHWDAIDLIVKRWVESRPKEYQSFLIEVKEKRETRATSYGSNKSRNFRSLVDIPLEVMQQIRTVYPVGDLEFDMEFCQQLYKRYPFMRASEKL